MGVVREGIQTTLLPFILRLEQAVRDNVISLWGYEIHGRVGRSRLDLMTMSMCLHLDSASARTHRRARALAGSFRRVRHDEVVGHLEREASVFI